MSNSTKKLPKVMVNKAGSKLVKTPYGSYVNPDEDGMAQQKNAISYREAIKFGYIDISLIS